jgi:very-short-patch-repair endonuclease
MDLISQVTLMGGACDRASLVRLRGSSAVDAALRDGTLVRTARGRYALSRTQEAVKRASAVAGVLSHRSAALHWGWAQKVVPARAEVTIPRDRRMSPGVRNFVVPHWSDLDDEDVEGMVTTPRRTIVDCMRNLPPDESLAIVDSAIRADDFTHQEVADIAESTRGRGRARIRATAAAATSKAANPFESVLRSQALAVPGLQVEAQLAVPVPGTGIVLHPDLGDPVLKIALEAEGFEWHGDPAALTRDCRRYNLLSLLGWQVIRFSWYLVMYQPAYVHRTLVAAVALAARHANVA